MARSQSPEAASDAEKLYPKLFNPLRRSVSQDSLGAREGLPATQKPLLPEETARYLALLNDKNKAGALFAPCINVGAGEIDSLIAFLEYYYDCSMTDKKSYNAFKKLVESNVWLDYF